jgi:hypothetical protein
MTAEVFKKQGGRRFETLKVHCREISVNEIPQETGAQMPVQQVVLKLVLIASQAAVTRPVAALRATFQNLESLIEDRGPQSAYPFSKSRAARQGVIQIDFGFATVPSWIRECWSVFGL